MKGNAHIIYINTFPPFTRIQQALTVFALEGVQLCISQLLYLKVAAEIRSGKFSLEGTEECWGWGRLLLP